MTEAKWYEVEGMGNMLSDKGNGVIFDEEELGFGDVGEEVIRVVVRYAATLMAKEKRMECLMDVG